MKLSSNLIPAAALVLILVPGMAAAGDGNSGSAKATQASVEVPATMAGAKAILPLAEEAGFTTLVAAVKAAGLEEALAGDGPFTVFAPTDEAFAKLPEGTVESLLANPEALKKVLLYHVVSGSVMAADVVKLEGAVTLNGARVAIDARDGVKINGSTVIKADIRAANGVVHVIDTVLIPEDR